jgi:hypothetical protein
MSEGHISGFLKDMYCEHIGAKADLTDLETGLLSQVTCRLEYIHSLF